MSSDRTEKPTARKLREARRKGQVARSRDLGQAAALIGVIVVLGWIGPSMARTLEGQIRIAFDQMGDLALTTLGAFTFLHHWNDLLWPLIVLKDRSRWTINLLVTSLQGYAGTNRHLEVAGAAMAVIPIIILVVILQRYVVQSIAMTGLKG